MGLLWKERRGPAWKHGWTVSTLSSISAPPLPLVLIIGIVIFLLSISSYLNYKSTMQNVMINFNMILLVLPLLLIFITHSVSRYGQIVIPALHVKQQFLGQAGRSPWGVAALVVLLLVLVSYQPTFKSMWSPVVWRS